MTPDNWVGWKQWMRNLYHEKTFLVVFSSVLVSSESPIVPKGLVPLWLVVLCGDDGAEMILVPKFDRIKPSGIIVWDESGTSSFKNVAKARRRSFNPLPADVGLVSVGVDGVDVLVDLSCVVVDSSSFIVVLATSAAGFDAILTLSDAGVRISRI